MKKRQLSAMKKRQLSAMKERRLTAMKELQITAMKELQITAKEEFRILVVDDDENTRPLTVLEIQDADKTWVVSSAPNAQTARKLIRQAHNNNKPFHVLLTDQIMEERTSGVDLIHFALGIDPQCKMILFSARKDVLDLNRNATFETIDKTSLCGEVIVEIIARIKRVIGALAPKVQRA